MTPDRYRCTDGGPHNMEWMTAHDQQVDLADRRWTAGYFCTECGYASRRMAS